jgi:uncharacterized membrane protein YwaF
VLSVEVIAQIVLISNINCTNIRQVLLIGQFSVVKIFTTTVVCLTAPNLHYIQVQVLYCFSNNISHGFVNFEILQVTVEVRFRAKNDGVKYGMLCGGKSIVVSYVFKHDRKIAVEALRVSNKVLLPTTTREYKYLCKYW